MIYLCCAKDDEVLGKEVKHNKIVVTMEKDFGFLAYTYSLLGVLFLRLMIPTLLNILEVILRTSQLGERFYG